MSKMDHDPLLPKSYSAYTGQDSTIYPVHNMNPDHLGSSKYIRPWLKSWFAWASLYPVDALKSYHDYGFINKGQLDYGLK